MRRWPLVILLVLVAVGFGALGERIALDDSGHLLAYFGAGVLGLLVGVTELVARYRDDPLAVIKAIPGLIYISVNAAVSLIVFWLLHTGQLGSNVLGDTPKTLTEVLTAGVGSMALFRTSLFTLRVKESDIAIGPAAILQVILSAADRACDRDRAGPRARAVKEIMSRVSFERARIALPLHCVTLMQNLSAEERSQLDKAVTELAAQRMSDEVKAYNLGLLLMNIVGQDVLHRAIETLGSVIQGPPPDDPPILTQAAQLSGADLRALVQICLELDPEAVAGDPVTLKEAWLAPDPDLPPHGGLALVVLLRLRRAFGADTVAKALGYLAYVSTDQKVRAVTATTTPSDFTRPSGGAGPNPGV